MKNVVFLTLFFASFFCNAQDVYNPKELFDEGQYFFVRKDYQEALYFYKNLTETDVDNAHFNFKVGECYLNIPGREHLAVPFFEKAVKNTVPKREFKSKDFNEKSAPLHAFFYLGNAYRMNSELESALLVYNEFLNSPDFYENYNLEVVETEIKSCEVAKIIQDTPISMAKTRLKVPIDSDFSEYKPVVSHNGKKLVFIRELKFYNAIFVSENTDGEWSTPKNISSEIGSDGDFYPTGMNTDGTVILFSRESEENEDVYYSELQGQSWSPAQKIPGKINSSARETYASFGEDDNTIYLVSNRQSGRGGKDILISNKLDDGTWGKPRNLGKTINTKLDEESPVFCRRNKTLYFSSKGHYNMGGYDIFYSSNTTNTWEIPENIGYPLNTTRDDLYFVLLPNCNNGYYSIIDHDSGMAKIYLIEIDSTLAMPE